MPADSPLEFDRAFEPVPDPPDEPGLEPLRLRAPQVDEPSSPPAPLRPETKKAITLRGALLANPSPDLVPGTNARAHALRAALARDAGTMRRALREADAALAKDRYNADAIAVRARALAELGGGPEAWSALRQLEWVDPGNESEIRALRTLLGMK